MNRIKKIRQLRSMSQNELAEKVGISNSILSRYENGIVKPSGRRLAAIANALHVSTDTLIDATDVGGRIELMDPANDIASESLSDISSFFSDYQDLTLRNKDSNHLNRLAYYYGEMVLRKEISMFSNGCCELCGKPAPFVDKYGDPYLEVHVIKPYSIDEAPKPSNTVVLCPNCHRRIHVCGTDEDEKKLLEISSQHKWNNSMELLEKIKGIE